MVSGAGSMRLPARLGLAAICLGAAACGFLPHAPAANGALTAADHELANVLRFMATLKGLMAAAAWGLTHWRLRHPAPIRIIAGSLLGCALMAAAPGLIWTMQHVLLGGALTYAGTALLLLTVWADRAGWEALIAAWLAARQRRVTGTATSFRLRGGNVQGGS